MGDEDVFGDELAGEFLETGGFVLRFENGEPREAILLGPLGGLGFILIVAEVDHGNLRVVCDVLLVGLHQLWSRSAAGASPTGGVVDEVSLRGEMEISGLKGIPREADGISQEFAADGLRLESGLGVRIGNLRFYRGRIDVRGLLGVTANKETREGQEGDEEMEFHVREKCAVLGEDRG